MERHCDNAERIASRLAESSAVSHVLYPGLADDPGHAVARRQMRRFGGMVSFRVHGGRAAADQALVSPGVWTLGESLGGVESLVEHPGRDDARLARRLRLRGAGRPDPPLGRASSTPDDLERDLDAMLVRAERVALAAR